ncbi:MAG: DUF1003 domain-containing protein [Candidatus Pacebacteria bacterium]|mgnify:FL=1|jgi:uncharacterized membrane protein|nr:DUF1003 domain-containing protein [Candidatus Paceibacterota bacterium]MBT3512352.1 DUF1003 domain-containing protein [Candidatus Paceibacterota bacterium]MBT4004535.1 DUF1003 domain-containing protein [Candidatus Paceibacterota bacterium]MBT4358625.1 DUF1003 domain-containing protein [Candidatus Paceibacterota bacterium]MBT4680625.1 DUF1003 domain-containing protein [Candidatus Paceibacterota bacterium]
MTDKQNSHQPQKTETFLSKSAVIFVRIFGSWASVAVHTLIFGGWFIFKLDLEQLLVIVSIEAIYIGIFILMAENIETAQRERLREIERRKDMAVVKQDVVVDKKSLKEVKEVHQKIDQIQELIKNK